jgi:hypothetical protein
MSVARREPSNVAIVMGLVNAYLHRCFSEGPIKIG